MVQFASAPAPSAGNNGPNDVPRDQYGRYLIPRYPFDGPMLVGHDPVKGEGMAQPWTRASTFSHALQDQTNLTGWKLRHAVKGVAIRPDLYALAASTPLSSRSQLDDIVGQSLDAAAMRSSSNLGTALHQFTEAVDRGEDTEVPPPWDRDIEAYRRTLDEHGIRMIPGLMEQRVVAPQLADGNAAGVAGTFDRIVMWNGRPTIADLKTGSDPLKYGSHGISMQLGIYANAYAMWDGEAFRPMPEGLRNDVGLVFHLPVGTGRCIVYEVDLRPGVAAVELALGVRKWMKTTDLYVKAVPGMAAESAPSQPEPVDVVVTAHVVDEPVETSKPSGRTCSVCRKPGHRKGSPKCLGPDGDVEAAESRLAAPGSIDEMIAGGGTHEGQGCTYSGWHVPEWTSRPDVTVCGRCAFPSKATLARLTGERSGLNNLADPFTPPTPVETVAQPEPAEVKAAPEPVKDDDSMFEDDKSEDQVDDPRGDFLDALALAESKADIRELRAKAKELGLWDDDMLQVALARISELS